MRMTVGQNSIDNEVWCMVYGDKEVWYSKTCLTKTNFQSLLLFIFLIKFVLTKNIVWKNKKKSFNN